MHACLPAWYGCWKSLALSAKCATEAAGQPLPPHTRILPRRTVNLCIIKRSRQAASVWSNYNSTTHSLHSRFLHGKSKSQSDGAHLDGPLDPLASAMCFGSMQHETQSSNSEQHLSTREHLGQQATCALISVALAVIVVAAAVVIVAATVFCNRHRLRLCKYCNLFSVW